MPFSPSVKVTALLWSDRHCCLCKERCGANIEVHHIVPEPVGSNEIDNAIPLCFDCHAEVGSYNDKHARGNKYKPAELRARREQVYEEFTRHLVPPVICRVTQRLPHGATRKFPDVGFDFSHGGDSLPVRVRVKVQSILDNGYRRLLYPHYSGDALWNLNLRLTIRGHVTLPGMHNQTRRVSNYAPRYP